MPKWHVLFPSSDESCIQVLPSALSYNGPSYLTIHNTQTYLCTKPHTQIACSKLHHFPAVVWKLHLSPHCFTNHSTGLLYFVAPAPSLLPSLTILGSTLHFSSALLCQAWIVMWTVWGGRGQQEMCVNAQVTALSPTLFIFLPKWCCQEPNKISLPPDRELAEEGCKNGIKE